MKAARQLLSGTTLALAVGCATGAETIRQKPMELVGRARYASAKHSTSEGMDDVREPRFGVMELEMTADGQPYVLPSFVVEERRRILKESDLSTRKLRLDKGFKKYPGLLITPWHHKGLALYFQREDEDLKREGDWARKLPAIYFGDPGELKEMHEILDVTVMRRKRSR